MIGDEFAGKNAPVRLSQAWMRRPRRARRSETWRFMWATRCFDGIGFGLMISIAVTVGLAILGTTLSCLNTAVRVSYAMAKDDEMPEFLGAMHGKFATPHKAVWVLVFVSCGIALIGVQSVVGLTGITLASNFGTFVLYALTCIWTIVAFRERKEYSTINILSCRRSDCSSISRCCSRSLPVHYRQRGCEARSLHLLCLGRRVGADQLDICNDKQRPKVSSADGHRPTYHGIAGHARRDRGRRGKDGSHSRNPFFPPSSAVAEDRTRSGQMLPGCPVWSGARCAAYASRPSRVPEISAARAARSARPTQVIELRLHFLTRWHNDPPDFVPLRGE